MEHYDWPVTVNQPAAGADATITCPTSEEWLLRGCSFTLTVDTTAGNRTPVVQVDDAGGVQVIAAAAGYAIIPAVVGTSSARWTFMHGLAEWDQANDAFASGPMPLVRIRSGQKVTVHVENLATADQLSSVRLLVEQYPVYVPA